MKLLTQPRIEIEPIELFIKDPITNVIVYRTYAGKTKIFPVTVEFDENDAIPDLNILHTFFIDSWELKDCVIVELTKDYMIIHPSYCVCHK